MAERIYCILMWLYPAEHRQAYGGLMLQHARDLERDAFQRRGWQLLYFYLRLIKDGVLNAGREQWEVIMGNNRFTPASWFTVLLAAIPGLLLVFERVNIIQLAPILQSLVVYGYLAILIVGVPLFWYRQRRFPAWALLPAGLMLWMAVFLAGNLLIQLLSALGWLAPHWQDALVGTALIQIGLTVGLFVLLLRGQRLPASIWLVIGVIVLVNLLGVVRYISELSTIFGPYSGWTYSGPSHFVNIAGFGMLEGLLFVAAGMLAARQHGVLALLVVVGGFGYMLTDSDYISGFRLHEWAGYTAYVLSLAALYMVVTPVALLRARARLGRALAVFVPVGIFHIARITVPMLVLPGPQALPWGDVILSANVMLSLVLGWVLYSNIEKATHGEEILAAVSNPPQPVLSG